MKGVQGGKGPKGAKGKPGPPVRHFAHTIQVNKCLTWSTILTVTDFFNMHFKLDCSEYCLFAERFVPCSQSEVICSAGKARCTRQAQAYTKTEIRTWAEIRSKKWAQTPNKTLYKTEIKKCTKIQTDNQPSEAKGRATKSKFFLYTLFYTMSSFVCINLWFVFKEVF